MLQTHFGFRKYSARPDVWKYFPALNTFVYFIKLGIVVLTLSSKQNKNYNSETVCFKLIMLNSIFAYQLGKQNSEFMLWSSGL
jgi:hypothetical protein